MTIKAGTLIRVDFLQMIKLPRACGVPMGLPRNGIFEFKKVVRGTIHEWEFMRVVPEGE